MPSLKESDMRSMWRTLGVTFWMSLVVALSGCGGGSAPQTPGPTPSPTPTRSSGSVSITAVSPTSVAAGSPDFTLRVTGSNLDLVHAGDPLKTHTYLLWWSGGEACKTLNVSIISSTQLSAAVTSDLVTAPATISISIQKWFFADDFPFASSHSVTFIVNAAAAMAVSPSAETLGPNGSKQ